MIIEKLSKANRMEWDNFARINNEAWLFHLSDWSEICQQACGQESFSFMIKNGRHGSVEAIMPLSLQRIKGFNILWSSGYGEFGGTVLDNDLSDEARQEVSTRAYEHLQDIAKECRADFAFIKLSPSQKADSLSQYYKNASVPAYLIDLSSRTEKLWSGLSVSCRNAIRQAEKKGVKVIRAEGENDIEDFYGLLKENFSRTKAKLIPREYFQSIWQRLGRDKGMANLFFAEYNGRRIAGHIIAKYKEGALYWSSGSKADIDKVRANNLIQWHAIQWSKEEGCKWYVSGEAFPKAHTKKEQGIDLFKKSFGGKISQLPLSVKVYNRKKYYIYRTLQGFRNQCTLLRYV